MSWILSTSLVLLFTINLTASKSLNYKAPKDVLECKDENNQPVDWFVIYKIPKVAQSSEPSIRKGLAYLYITSTSVERTWKFSTKNISSVESLPGRTLSPLYKKALASRSMWIMYNDQAPNGTSNAKHGHAKGVVMTDGEKGFWLIHSVPGFPPIPEAGIGRSNDTEKDYAYPDSGTNYGQSFLCISVNADQINTISRQLIFNQIITYRKNLPNALAKAYPTFVDAANRVAVKNPPYNNKEIIESSNGAQFISFAKTDRWQKDLYSDFVAPQLNSDILTETWRNGPGKLPSHCTGAKVMNVQSIGLPQANVDFTSSHDHSKWAVSALSGARRHWVCVGDINRADTQYNRGGGTVCYNSTILWEVYRNSVRDIEPCPNTKKRPRDRTFVQKFPPMQSC